MRPDWRRIRYPECESDNGAMIVIEVPRLTRNRVGSNRICTHRYFDNSETSHDRPLTSKLGPVWASDRRIRKVVNVLHPITADASGSVRNGLETWNPRRTRGQVVQVLGTRALVNVSEYWPVASTPWCSKLAVPRGWKG
jgi:hypothetical protein